MARRYRRWAKWRRKTESEAADVERRAFAQVARCDHAVMVSNNYIVARDAQRKFDALFERLDGLRSELKRRTWRWACSTA